MSWLAPWYLLALGAVAIPIALHLIRRLPRGRQAFSTLMFLRPSPPRLQRRSRLDNLLLLLLRLAVLVLLAIAFARPFFRREALAPLTSVGRVSAVLVDTSASMRRPGLWAAAQQAARDAITQAGATDQVALYSFDHRLVTRVPASEDPAPGASSRTRALSALGQLRPSWNPTDLGGAITAAVDQLEPVAARRPVELVVVSDFQAGAELDALRDYAWPEGLQVRLEPVSAATAGNASVRILRSEDDESLTRKALVRVQNAPDSEHDRFTLVWKSGNQVLDDAPPLHVQVAPGKLQVLNVDRPEKADRIELQGDDCAFDNTFYIGPLLQQTAQILYMGTDDPADPNGSAYFAQMALADLVHLDCQMVYADPSEPLGTLQPGDPDVVMVARELSEADQQALAEYQKQGGTVLVVLTSGVDPNGLGPLLGGGIRLGRPTVAHSDGGWMLEQIDLTHPLLNRFADPRYADFTKIRFWNHWPLELDAAPNRHVLARFEGGDPYLWHEARGTGHLLVMTAGWQPADGQLAVSTKFVPLLAGVVELATQTLGAPDAWWVGHAATLEQLPGGDTTPATLVRPDGKQVALAAGEAEVEFDEPGIYRLQRSGQTHVLAVNLSQRESQTAADAQEKLAEMGLPAADQPAVVRQLARRRQQLQQEELEDQQRLWQWLLAGALLMMAAESWTAGRAPTLSRVQEERGSE